jgi:hypothetical protein
MMNLKYFVFLSFALVYIMTNSNCTTNTASSKQLNMVDGKFYKRDSLFIIHTIKEWCKNTTTHFDIFKDFDKDESFRIIIDTILYDKNKLKLFALSILDYDASFADMNSISNRLYDSRSIIGFRENLNEIWKLYHFGQYTGFVFEDFAEIKSAQRDFYFNQLSQESQYIPDTNKLNNHPNNRIPAHFKYNLGDEDFWTKSIIWQKGLRIPGYYNFQTDGNVDINSKNPLVPEIHIEYPDSLLKMFRDETH